LLKEERVGEENIKGRIKKVITDLVLPSALFDLTCSQRGKGTH